MKVVYCGLEGSGKSLILADDCKKLLKRNKRWYKKAVTQYLNNGMQGEVPERRQLYSNLKFSDEIEEKYFGYIAYWTQLREVIRRTGVDVIWDEINTDLDANKIQQLPRRVKNWLKQGQKQGVHLYATAQEFHDIHVNMRRRIHEAYYMKKIAGTRRSGKNLPPTRMILGMCLKRRIKFPYNELEPQFTGFSLFSIRGKKTRIFNTNQLIEMSEEVPYEHIEIGCERDHKGQTCSHLGHAKRVLHLR